MFYHTIGDYSFQELINVLTFIYMFFIVICTFITVIPNAVRYSEIEKHQLCAHNIGSRRTRLCLVL